MRIRKISGIRGESNPRITQFSFMHHTGLYAIMLAKASAFLHRFLMPSLSGSVETCLKFVVLA
ncbi:MAG: hypothetical protein DSY55_05715 [Clostridia bacterium]|nr:MAG: hypothetical protein DSY55_05715 [Clostridia bacterium]